MKSNGATHHSLSVDDTNLSEDDCDTLPHRVRAYSLAALTAFNSAFAGCADVDRAIAPLTDKRAAFASLRSGINGSTPDEARAVMGSPLSTEQKSVIGLTSVAFTWRDGHQDYEAIFLAERAVYLNSKPISKSKE